MATQLQSESKTPIGKAFTPVPTGLLQRKCACGSHSIAGGECAECKNNRLGLQRKATGINKTSEVPPIVHEVLGSPGQPLDPVTRAFMEPRFGHDFSDVRVHTDSRAADSALAVSAQAYTVGNNVVFGKGQFTPGAVESQKLLAHELTHVVQQLNTPPSANLRLDSETENIFESSAQAAELAITANPSITKPKSITTTPESGIVQRRIIRDHVSCQQNGLTNPDLTGDEVVAALEAADAEAIALALRAELLLDVHLLFARAGEPVDPDFDTILQEELGLTLTNPTHFRLIEQQRDRFKRVRETLESGFLRYLCRGGTVNLVGCAAGTCGNNFAFTCPGNRLVVLCQAFWDNPDQRAATILHEPFHIWFSMERHATNALRRADSSCFESFALRVAGQAAFASCAGHTAG